MVYIALVFYTELNVAFVAALALAPLYILYSNFKYSLVASIFILVVNIINFILTHMFISIYITAAKCYYT